MTIHRTYYVGKKVLVKMRDGSVLMGKFMGGNDRKMILGWGSKKLSVKYSDMRGNTMYDPMIPVEYTRVDHATT